MQQLCSQIAGPPDLPLAVIYGYINKYRSPTLHDVIMPVTPIPHSLSSFTDTVWRRCLMGKTFDEFDESKMFDGENF